MCLTRDYDLTFFLKGTFKQRYENVWFKSQLHSFYLVAYTGLLKWFSKIIWDSWVALVFTMSNNRDMIHVENGAFVILLYIPDFDHTYFRWIFYQKDYLDRVLWKTIHLLESAALELVYDLSWYKIWK